MKGTVLLAHGSGGILSRELIKNVFVSALNNKYLAELDDSAIIELEGTRLALTTDSYVVRPLFFPGGTIGTLAIAGTINDLAVMGARPVALTCGVIIEEGFSIAVLEDIAAQMAVVARDAGIPVVTGDTKVVEKGKADGVYITTAGTGIVSSKFSLGMNRITVGDVLIVSGNLGDHALAVLSAREDLGLKGGIESDCAPLHGLVMSLEECGRYIKFMRDLTRGGLAGVVSEIIEDRAFGLQISESSIPLGEATRNACELLGLDALYLANEGKILLVVEGQHADKIVGLLRKHPLGCEARIVGEVVPGPPGKAYLVTTIGTRRVLEPPFDDQLPRIC